MLKIFYPYEYVESVFSIDYKKLYEKGYRGLIFDIDNTLVHHGEDSTREIDELFKEVQKIGFKTLVLSNNSEKRVQKFLLLFPFDIIVTPSLLQYFQFYFDIFYFFYKIQELFFPAAFFYQF